MAKLSRALQKIFGSTAVAGQIRQIGSLASGTPVSTTDPVVLQALSNYLNGWPGCVMGNNSPAMEDMTALHYLITRQLAYVFQQGIPEWDSATEYHIGSIAQDGLGNIFLSLTNDNIGNALTSFSNWRLVVSNGNGINKLINSEFRFMQEFGNVEDGTNGPQDGEFAFDQWILQTDAPAAQILCSNDQFLTVPFLWSDTYGIAANKTDSTAYQAGFLQMLDAETTSLFRGRQAVFRIYLASSVTRNMRMAIVSWDGAADSFNRSCVDSWGATPTLKTNWTIVNTPASIEVGLSQNEYFVTATVPNGSENVGVFFWTETDLDGDTDDAIYFSGSSFELGSFPSIFKSKPYNDDLLSCQRFYEKTSDINSSILENGISNNFTAFSQAESSSSVGNIFFNFRATKYKNPSMTYSAVDGGVNYQDKFLLISGGSLLLDSGTATAINVYGGITFANNGMGLTSGNAYPIHGNWVADSRLGV